MNDNLASTMPFSTLMGVEVTDATPEQVRGTLTVRDDLCTTGGILHGGAIMALADSLGAIAAFLNLPEGAAGTTTIESKTNFLGPAPAGTRVVAETTPVKVGRRLSILQTDVRDEAGKHVARVTQTQLVL